MKEPKYNTVEGLLRRAENAIKKDLVHITKQVDSGKLDGSVARDLVAYTKLLREAVEAKKAAAEVEKDELKSMSQEELEAKLNALIKPAAVKKQPQQPPIFDLEARKKIMSETGE